MKLTSHRLVGWRNLCLRGFVVILGMLAAATVASAQESKSADDAAKPATVGAESAKPTTTKRVVDPKMPDISGTWRMGKDGGFGECVIQRVDDDAAEFTFEAPDPKGKKNRQRLKWSRGTQRFEFVQPSDIVPEITGKATLQLLPDQKTMLFKASFDEPPTEEFLQESGLTKDELGQFLNQEWTRTKKPVGNAAEPVATPAESAKPVPAKPDGGARMPDAIRALMPSIVTVIRVDPKTGLPNPNPNGQAGVIVDPRGYILTPFMEGLSKAKPCKVRLANQQEFVAEVAATDETHLMVLKIVSPYALAAVSLAKLREPQVGDAVFVVPSPAGKGPSVGIVTATSRSLPEYDETTFIQTDIKLPKGEEGSLLVSALGEPIGIPVIKWPDEQPICFARPLKTALSIIQVATKVAVAADVAASPRPAADAKMPDISGKWTFKRPPLPFKDTQEGAVMLRQTYVVSRSEEAETDFEFWESSQPKTTASRVKWIPGTQRFQVFPKGEKDNYKAQATLELSADGNTLSLRLVIDAAERERLAAQGGVTGEAMERLLNQEWRRFGPEEEGLADRIGGLVGTWNRAESGTFSKLTIWPVENRESLVFVDGEDVKGLLEWKPAEMMFHGFFTFNVLGDWTVEATLRDLTDGRYDLVIAPFEGQRKGLLRGGFAKTERELDQKLRATWNRNYDPDRPKPLPTVTVVKTEFNPAPVRNALRAKYREPPYRFFSNDTFRSVIAIAPEDAQEEIEFLIHKLDVKNGPFDEVASPNIAPATPANQPLPTSRRPDQVVPDITGTWRVAIWYQEKGKYEPVEAGVMEIRRVGAESFLIDQPWVEKATRIFVEWSDANRRFQGIWGNDEGHSKITLQPASDNNTTLRVVVTKTSTPKGPLKKGGNEQGSEEKSSSQQWPQEWTRVSLTLSTTQENHIDLTGAAPDTVSHRTKPTRVVSPTALPDTPAAKRLVEQLGTQESAAAAEAATIRQLQANGQAEQNRQAIAEHQRKLKNLLSTAFDLKLQWEELQVQELQSRLSRLERQIGQRKELREKIINRRAGELIEGDALKWSQDSAAIWRSNDREVTAGGAQPGQSKPAGKESTVVSPSPVPIPSKPAPVAPTDPKSELLAKLQGRWELQIRTQFPNNQSDPVSLREFAEIKDNLMTGWSESDNKRENEGIILLKLGEPGPPQQIDLITNPNDGEDRTVMPGLIEVVDDVVRICFDPTSDSVRPEVIAVGKKADIWELRRKTGSGDPKLDPLPSPEQLRKQLQPIADRVRTAAARVRELEPVYFRDRSNAAELQRAFEEMNAARIDYRQRVSATKPGFKQIEEDYNAAGNLAIGLRTQYEAKFKLLAEGKTTEAEIKAVADSLKRATETMSAIKGKSDSYNFVSDLLPQDGDAVPEENELPLSTTRSSYDPAIAMAWLEATTNLKLEFVRFDELKLPFKAALRIRGFSPPHQIGDLITSLDGQRFESLDQAVAALRPNLRLKNTRAGENSIVRRGGLAGRRVKWEVSKDWPIDYLQPTTPVRATVGLEVRVRGAKPEEIETGYVTGTCVSPDGLVVIPFSAKSLVETEPAIAFGEIKGTARIVASDNERGLTLLKLESPNHQLFGWLKCRTGLPTKGQRLELFQDVNRFFQTSVSVVEQPYPAPHVGTDGFIATAFRGDTAPIGSPLMSVENELQGIVVESKPPPNQPDQPDVANPEPLQRNFGIPAVHIQKLIDEYRRSTAKLKLEAQASSQPPKDDAP